LRILEYHEATCIRISDENTSLHRVVSRCGCQSHMIHVLCSTASGEGPRRVPLAESGDRGGGHDDASDRRRAGDAAPSHTTDDILSVLVHSRIDGEALSDQVLRGVFVLFATAGNDTTRTSTEQSCSATIQSNGRCR
jgi:hypothetical protein